MGKSLVSCFFLRHSVVLLLVALKSKTSKMLNRSSSGMCETIYSLQVLADAEGPRDVLRHGQLL